MEKNNTLIAKLLIENSATDLNLRYVNDLTMLMFGMYKLLGSYEYGKRFFFFS